MGALVSFIATPVRAVSPFSPFSSGVDRSMRESERTPTPYALEIRHPPVIAPVTTAAPPKRLVLGPADLARLGVLLALKLGRRALSDAAAQGARRGVQRLFLLC